EWVHVQLHQQKGMISLSPPTICNSAGKMTIVSRLAKKGRFPVQMSFSEDGCTERQKPTAL
ncbi:hypothetical protein OU666_00040, partial [Escherichia coli]|nr:hypothetical protein [Escherichia coli]MDF8432523.1 hypothetical protein [Escherichia coli]